MSRLVGLRIIGFEIRLGKLLIRTLVPFRLDAFDARRWNARHRRLD
ncbi:MAG: hypothetical protein U1E83_03200 [Methylotetracoccus sp.]